MNNYQEKNKGLRLGVFAKSKAFALYRKIIDNAIALKVVKSDSIVTVENLDANGIVSLKIDDICRYLMGVSAITSYAYTASDKTLSLFYVNSEMSVAILEALHSTIFSIVQEYTEKIEGSKGHFLLEEFKTYFALLDAEEEKALGTFARSHTDKDLEAYLLAGDIKKEARQIYLKAIKL